MKGFTGVKLIWLFAGLLIHFSLRAQEWAGPDVTTCQTAGAMLGLASAPNDYCYNWSPAAGLSSTTDKQPMAHPDKTTIYTLTAVGPNFSNKVVDQVKVTVSTGGVVLTPTYTEPDSEDVQAHAHLTSKEAGVMYRWSIDGDSHGCRIDSITGVVGHCNQVGEVTIKVKDKDNPSCSATGPFRINVGVKDVMAIDETNPTRIASTGDTLHLVGINAVRLKAIPNSGETFNEDQPDWTGSTVLPPNPNDAEWVNNQGEPSSLTITAGQKTVYVSREGAGEISLGGIPQFFKTVVTAITEFVKPSAELTKGHSFMDFQAASACLPPAPPLPGINISLKAAPVNKKDSPQRGYIYTAEGELGATLSGKICFPPPYSSVPNPVLVWSTYIELSGTAKAVMNFTLDESKAVPAKWESNLFNFTTEFKLGVGTQLGLLLPDDIFGITGSVFGGIKIGLDPDVDLTTKLISVTASIEPLVLEGGLKVWYFNPNNTVVDLQGKYNILDPFTYGPTPILTLPSF